MKLLYRNGITSVILRVKILDTSSVTGAGKTGLTHSSSGLIISTIADVEASPTAYTQAGSTVETITTLGTFAAPTATKCRFKEVSSTNHPGLYEIQIADARWAVSGARSAIVTVSGVSGAAQVDAEIQLEKLYLANSSFGTATLDGTFTFVTAADVAAAVADEQLSGHTDPGSLALALQELDTDLSTVDSTANAIQAKTDQMVFTTANRLNTQVYGMEASVITATAIATDAITAAKIAANAITSSELADGAITAAKFADNAITAAKIAADAIGASELATDAVSEIKAALVAALAEINLDHLLAVAAVAGDVVNNSVIARLASKSATPAFTSYDNTTDSMEAVRDNLATAAALATAQTSIDDLPTNAELTTALGTADDAILTRLGTPAGASIAADIAAIEAQTDDIGVAGAGLTGLPWNPAWDDEVQSEVADALTAYDPPTRTEATSDVNSVLARLPAALTGAGNMKADILAIDDNSSVVDLLVAGLGLEAIGTVASGTLTTTSFTTNLTETEPDAWRRSTLVFLSGTLIRQRHTVIDYDESNGLITVDEAFTEAPDPGDQFLLI